MRFTQALSLQLWTNSHFLTKCVFLFYVLSLFDLIRFINRAITFKIIAPSSFMPRHCDEWEDESYNFVGTQKSILLWRCYGLRIWSTVFLSCCFCRKESTSEYIMWCAQFTHKLIQKWNLTDSRGKQYSHQR